MKIRLSTAVSGEYRAVMEGFDRSLFEQLVPPGIRTELLRFDGSETGNEVHLRLHIPLVAPQLWTSRITAHGSNEAEVFFIDEGEILPFFLSKWRHRHVVARSETGSIIIDDISFETPRWLPEWLLFPVLWLQFAYRKPIYRRVFAAK